MYHLHKSKFGKHERFDLSNDATGNGFSVVPAAGVNVLDIVFGGKSILDGYASPEELAEGKWGKSTVLFPFPNRLDGGRYTWRGKQYQFPINNAATGNAIHGFVREETFRPEYVFLAQDRAHIRCSYEYGGHRAYYPFPFLMELEFAISDSGSFEMEVEIENLHSEPIPVGFGWHPYFRLADSADAHGLQLPACERVAINERMIPTGQRVPYHDFSRKKRVGETVLDTCFAVSTKRGAYSLKLFGDGDVLSVRAPATTFPFFQVFTPPHRQSIALEPMSCNVDAFNNGEGLVALAPGEKYKGTVNVDKG
jgi:aldose 1-epimerase